MATKYINSVQQVSVTIAVGATTGTATVTAAVGTFIMKFQGHRRSSGASAGADAQSFCYVQISGTTVTATRGAAGTANTCTVNLSLIDATSNLVTSVQSGIISITTTTLLTATISSVVTTDSSVEYLGHAEGGGSFVFTVNKPVLTLTNATTVTGNIFHRTTSATVAYQVVNWNHAALNQNTQAFATSWLNSTTSTTQAITSVNVNNTMLVYAGNAQTSASGATDAVDFQMGQITGPTTITITCGFANSDTIQYNCTVVEFISGVLTQNAQRGTVTTATATSATATITSAATAQTAVYYTGWWTADSTTSTLSEVLPTITQTNATTVTQNLGTAGAVNVGFEALTFSNTGSAANDNQRRTNVDSGTRTGSRQMRAA